MNIFREYLCTSCGLLVTGVKESDCPKPCERTKVTESSNKKVVLLFKTFQILGRFLGATPYKTPKFDLTLDQEITVKESYYPTFSFPTFLANFGGSLGLWLGVGAVQIFSNAVDLATWCCPMKNVT